MNSKMTKMAKKVYMGGMPSRWSSLCAAAYAAIILSIQRLTGLGRWVVKSKINDASQNNLKLSRRSPKGLV